MVVAGVSGEGAVAWARVRVQRERERVAAEMRRGRGKVRLPVEGVVMSGWVVDRGTEEKLLGSGGVGKVCTGVSVLGDGRVSRGGVR